MKLPPTFENDVGPWEMPSSMLPTADWNAEALTGQLAPAVDPLRLKRESDSIEVT